MKSVIGRIIRNTRVKDLSYIRDMHDWIYEAMGMLRTAQSLIHQCEKVQVHFHKGKLPCGLVYIEAVEYNGHRLPEGNSVRTPGMNQSAKSNHPVFFSHVRVQEPDSNHLRYQTEIVAVSSLPVGKDYYQSEMGYINTSFENGTVKIYYRAIPTDEDGLPLIPDNENYKQAIYWYVRSMMIGAGYKDTQYTADQCLEKFERLYGPRAINEIRYPSPDQMEHRVNTLSRFIAPASYYESFFTTNGPERFYDTDTL